MEFILMNKNNLKEKKSFLDKIKYLCSIPVKNEGRALNTIFSLCVISIIALGIYIYRSSTGFYEYLDSTIENNVSMNMEVLRNEHIDYVEDLINNRLYEFEQKEKN